MNPLQSRLTMLLLAGSLGCETPPSPPENAEKSQVAAPPSSLPAQAAKLPPPPLLAYSANDAANLQAEDQALPHAELRQEHDRHDRNAVRRDPASDPQPQLQLPPQTEAERQALFAKRAQLKADWQQAARSNINSKDKDKRLEAVRDLDPDDAFDLDMLLTRLNRDESAEVRAEIAGRLSFGEYPQAVPELLDALNDSSIDVVLAAIESLGWYDEGHQRDKVIEALKQLQEHSSERIKLAAVRASDLIGDF